MCYVNVSDWLYSWTAWGNGSILVILYVNLAFENKSVYLQDDTSLSNQNVTSIDIYPPCLLLVLAESHLALF